MSSVSGSVNFGVYFGLRFLELLHFWFRLKVSFFVQGVQALGFRLLGLRGVEIGGLACGVRAWGRLSIQQVPWNEYGLSGQLCTFFTTYMYSRGLNN